jgi:N-acetylneuraminic acid mutarotase
MVIISATVATAADAGKWTWVSGSNTFDQNGVYGTKGVAASGNMPGARYASVSWIDSSNNLWLFGGYGYVGPEMGMEIGNLSDLWKFDGTNWTWVSGMNTFNNYGNYGTKGAANPANMPSGRLDSTTWTDDSGNFWLFGGVGFDKNGNSGYLNDLWKFDGSNWTWVNGPNINNQPGIYGNIGEAGADNVPGGRVSSASWIDSDNNLWLFGGSGYDTNGAYGRLNDLWKFDGTNWTWVSGTSAADRHGVYGNLGDTESGNRPGSRNGSKSWIDANGNFWLFGGQGYDANSNSSPGYLNDLWKFDGTNWTWMNGSNIVNQPGIYGTTGTAEPDNVPGGRAIGASWIDNDGNFWLFGGRGYDVNSILGNLNDLWKFDGTNWAWFSGSDSVNQHGIYGTKGVPAIENIPWAKRYVTAWKDSRGTLWLFGGMGGSGPAFFNDLWKFSNQTLLFGNINGATKNTVLTVNDTNGKPVTFRLTGGGYGEITGGDTFDQINLYNTGEKSQLTITAKTETSIGDINSNGPLKAITAKTANLRKDIRIDGSLGALAIKNTSDGTIAIGTSLNRKAAVTIVFNEGDGLNINSNMPIKSISAFDWWGSLTAPSVGAITTKSDKKRDISGYLSIDVNTGVIGSVKVADGIDGSWDCCSVKSITALSIDDFYLTLRQQPNVKIPALGTLTIKNGFEYSRIISAGNIGTVTVGAMVNSSCFAGVADFYLVDVNAADGVLDLPSILGDTFSQEATIKSIVIKGIKNEAHPYFINSNIAAYHIDSMSVAYPMYDNSGAPFGFTMEEDPAKSLTIIDDQGKHVWKGYQIGTAIDWLTNLGYDMQIRRD